MVLLTRFRISISSSNLEQLEFWCLEQWQWSCPENSGVWKGMLLVRVVSCPAPGWASLKISKSSGWDGLVVTFCRPPAPCVLLQSSLLSEGLGLIVSIQLGRVLMDDTEEEEGLFSGDQVIVGGMTSSPGLLRGWVMNSAWNSWVMSVKCWGSVPGYWSPLSVVLGWPGEEEDPSY